MKLIIDIPKSALELLNTTGVDWLDAEHILSAVANGTPLDDVKAEIEEYKSTVDRVISEDELKIEGMKEAYANCFEILDNISKESEE